MVVDDEEGLLTLFTRVVEQAGCEVVGANHGRKAIAMLSETTPDLLVLDLAMPEINGYAVLRYVREQPHLANMRVLVLTATGPGPAPKDLADRIDSWAIKPIRPDTLIDLVHELLE